MSNQIIKLERCNENNMFHCHFKGAFGMVYLKGTKEEIEAELENNGVKYVFR